MFSKVHISDPFQNPENLQTTSTLTIQNVDVSLFQILTVFSFLI